MNLSMQESITNVWTSDKKWQCNHKYKACKAIYKCKIYITYGQVFISKIFFFVFLSFAFFFAFQAKYRKQEKVFIFLPDLDKYRKKVFFLCVLDFAFFFLAK